MVLNDACKHKGQQRRHDKGLQGHLTEVICFQVKGQKKGHQKVKVNADKQEVEIRKRMTVAELARAMNKDAGKTTDLQAT